MNRRIIKIVSIIAVVVLVIAIGLLLFFKFHNNIMVGEIEFGENYYLQEIRPHTFENVSINKNSYLKINNDKKTGVMHFINKDNQVVDIKFIVTKYQPGTTSTTIDIEYIYKNELVKATAKSDQNGIAFASVQSHLVDITQENPDDTRYLDYMVPTLVFQKEAA